MRYTKDNINGVTFRVGKHGNTIYIIDPYLLDNRGLSRVDGWNDDRMVECLNSGDWIEVIQVDEEWIKGQRFSEPEIY